MDIAQLWQPFAEFAFMRRALAAVAAVALGCAPLGCLLVLRRMSLMGDALAHAVLPGVAAGYLVAGLSLVAMSIGGFIAALLVALGAGLVTRHSRQHEDASFAAFYLIALALGVLLASLRGGQVDLMHLLFGSVLAVDDAALFLMAGIASLTVVALAVLLRPIVLESLDPVFLRSVGGAGSLAHASLLVLIALNLVGAFQALGSLMAVGMMMLPAVTARLWARDLLAMAAIATGASLLAGVAGLLVSYHYDLPSGPAIVLAAGLLYLVSLPIAPRGLRRTT